MARRWRILAVLFLARAAMGFQFQSVAAVSPLVMERFGVGLAELGALIGLYLLPGVALALPGGALGARFGDRRAVAFGLALMAAGGALSALGASWESQIAGRLVSGAGGVLLNVVMTKMVADWFAGREIATAMGVFVNSWPVGIALALLAAPAAAELGGGAPGAMWLAAALAAAGVVLILAGYRSPERAASGAPPAQRWIGGRALACVIVAGAVWGLYNAALAMIFSFGPALLTERGAPLAAASATTSLALWALALSVPLGGVLAYRLGRRDAVLAGGLAVSIGLYALAAQPGPAALVFAALGLVAGLPAGPIMSLPAAVLRPDIRSTGMGVFYAVYYLMIVAGPAAGGAAAERAGGASAAMLLGAGFSTACLLLLGLFRMMTKVSATRATAV